MTRKMTAFDEQHTSDILFDIYTELCHDNETKLNELWNLTTDRIAAGYAFFQNVLATTGRLTFRSAMRSFPAFTRLPDERKKVIFREIEYIKTIYENWSDIVHNCTDEIMTNVDVRAWPLWKLLRAVNYKFVEEENAIEKGMIWFKN